MRPSKRNELLEKALLVFYRKGFHATGMDTLVAETGISKTSMYKHFRSKEELILAVLRLRDEQFRNHFMRRVEELAETPRNRLIAMFDVLGEWFEEDGFKSCMFIKASSEFQDSSQPIHAISAEHKRLLFAFVRGLVADTGASDPDTLARQLILLKEGAIVTAHLGYVDDAAADAKRAAIVLIDAALPAAG